MTDRYLIRVPEEWDRLAFPHPLVFIHGLGLGLLQYHLTLSHLFETVTDRPILVILQPHISQDIFHPNFLQPMNRHQLADKLAILLKELGWAEDDFADDRIEDEDEKTVAKSLREKRKGVTILSHSK